MLKINIGSNALIVASYGTRERPGVMVGAFDLMFGQ
jgi:hypothetical protein